MPAPLRYAVARGLEAVEAPPFASLGEFSKALERFEKESSRDVLRGVLQRGARPSRPIPARAAVRPAPVTPPAPGPAPRPMSTRKGSEKAEVTHEEYRMFDFTVFIVTRHL